MLCSVDYGTATMCAEDAVSAAVRILLPHLGVLRAHATTVPRVREAADTAQLTSTLYVQVC